MVGRDAWRRALSRARALAARTAAAARTAGATHVRLALPVTAMDAERVRNVATAGDAVLVAAATGTKDQVFLLRLRAGLETWRCAPCGPAAAAVGVGRGEDDTACSFLAPPTLPRTTRYNLAPSLTSCWERTGESGWAEPACASPCSCPNGLRAPAPDPPPSLPLPPPPPQPPNWEAEVSGAPVAGTAGGPAAAPSLAHRLADRAVAADAACVVAKTGTPTAPGLTHCITLDPRGTAGCGRGCGPRPPWPTRTNLFPLTCRYA